MTSSFYKDTEGDVNLLNQLDQAVLDAQNAAEEAAASAAAALISANNAEASAQDALDTANGIIADLVGVAYQDEINEFTEANSFSDVTSFLGSVTHTGTTTFNNSVTANYPVTFNSLAILSAATEYDGDNLQDLLDAKIDVSQKGANSGVAPLNSSGKIDNSYLTNPVMIFQGQWNASTNTPTLADGDAYTSGDVFRVNTAGTQDLGSGNITFAVGDWVLKVGSGDWEKAANSISVDSVNGQSGTVVLNTDHIAEDGSPVNLWFTDARARTALGATTDDNLPSLITMTGRAADTTTLGTFTGSTISDSASIKSALQEIETAYEETDTNVNDLVTLSGVGENQVTLGSFTGTTITSNITIKAALQEIETAIERTSSVLPTPGATIDLTSAMKNTIQFATRNNSGAIVFNVLHGVFNIGDSVEIVRADAGTCTITPEASECVFYPSGSHAITDTGKSIVITRINPSVIGDVSGDECWFIRGAMD